MLNMSIPTEFWDILKVRKKWWLAPIIILLILFGALIVLIEELAIVPSFIRYFNCIFT